MNLYEKRARERANLLWEFYYENREKITTQDYARILKVKNPEEVIAAFEKRNIPTPARMNMYEYSANKKAEILWDFYYKNGEKITTQDCYRLMKTKNLKGTLDTFQKWGLKMPPRWGEPRVRTKRLADRLNAYADKLGVSELSTAEMAIALDRPKDQVHRARQECDRYDFKIPKLKIADGWRRKAYKKRRKETNDDRRVIDENIGMQPEYAEGFLIVEGGVRVNPDNPNEVFYMLR